MTDLELTHAMSDVILSLVSNTRKVQAKQATMTFEHLGYVLTIQLDQQEEEHELEIS